MRKCVFIAGIVFFASFLFVQPSKADNFNHYQLTGAAFGGLTISFTLPQTLTPSSVTWNGILNFTNVAGTWGKDGQNTPYNFSTIMIGSKGTNGTNYWASGGATRFVELEAPGLFTWNANGTVTLNTGTFALGDYNSFNGGRCRGNSRTRIVDAIERRWAGTWRTSPPQDKLELLYRNPRAPIRFWRTPLLI